MRPSRRSIVKLTVFGTLGRIMIHGRHLAAQGGLAAVRTVQTPTLTIAFEESGNPRGFPVILLHGFPDDVRAWDQVALPVADDGFRVIVPYLRGHGLTRFRHANAPRTGEQASL